MLHFFIDKHSLSVEYNQLTGLNVSNNIALESLNIRGNKITAIDISSNAELGWLEVQSNQLTTLDVSSNTALQSLHAYNNLMQNPDDVIGWRDIGLNLVPQGLYWDDNSIDWDARNFFFWELLDPDSGDNGSNNDGNNNGNRSSGGGSSGGGIRDAISNIINSNTPVNVTQAAANTAAQNALAAARATGSTVATVNFRNPGEISLATLKAMTNAATQAGIALRIQGDSMTVDNRAVNVRITFNPAHSTQNLNISASSINTQASQTMNTFTRFFSNDLMVVALGQQGSFGQTVRIAVKIAEGLNTNNLVFYTYDRTANSYRQIPAPNMWLDANGYVHFDVSMGGDIVISDGALKRRV